MNLRLEVVKTRPLGPDYSFDYCYSQKMVDEQEIDGLKVVVKAKEWKVLIMTVLD
jgi:Fe-S cluster assembly iron-binding protein IscA